MCENDTDCPDCGETMGTNGGCLLCVYAYEAGVGPQAKRDGRTGGVGQ